MKKEYSEHTRFQATTMSEADDSYAYSCIFDTKYFVEIEKIIKVNFKELEIENTSFYYRIQLDKDNLFVNFKSKEVKKSQDAQTIIGKIKEIEREISAITK